MLHKNDLDRTLKIWGPIKSPISKKTIELWGRIEPETVISLYRVLSKGLITTEAIASKDKGRSGIQKH